MTLAYRMVTRDFTPYTMIPRRSGIREYRQKRKPAPKRELAPHHKGWMSKNRQAINDAIEAKRQRIVGLYLLRLSRIEIAEKMDIPVREVNFHLLKAGYDFRRDSDISRMAERVICGEMGLAKGALLVGIGRDIFRDIVREMEKDANGSAR